ncbi:putative transcriptional regulator YdeE [Oxalobacteraceae bacterium GrIS 1.11]
MEAKTTHIAAFFVSGLSVRTMNRDEFNQEIAKIPGLWAQFVSSKLADTIPGRLPETPIYGVYSHYDSDATGFYDVTAGVAVGALAPDFAGVEIAEGEYLVFDAMGPMPAALIQAWDGIWKYFEQHPQVRRSFLTDFEAYCGAEKVQIHIGIAA